MDCPGPTRGDKLKERVVTDLTNLYGAALAASKGLDDRVVEIAKIDVINKLCHEDEKVYSCVLSSVHKDKLQFAVETNKRSFGADYPIALYEVRRRMLMKSSLADLENYMIDLDWGRYGHMVLKREFENTD